MLVYKKSRKSQRKNSFLFLFVRTYLILLTVLFSAVMIVSVYLLHTSRERQEEIGLNEMEKASTMFLQQIKELQDISCMLSEDSAVQTVAGLEKDLSPSDYIHLIELNDTLKRYYIFNENTKGINLWFGKNGIVHLGNSTISSAEHSSYKENYRFGTMGYDEYFDAFYQSGQMERLECVQVKNGTSQDTKIFYCVIWIFWPLK